MQRIFFIRAGCGSIVLLWLLIGMAAPLLSWADSLSQTSFPPPKDLPAIKQMPDPLVGDDGKKITTPQQWEQRRAQMKRIVTYYMYGTIPPPPGNVTGREIKTMSLAGGRVMYRLVRLSFGPGQKLGMEVAIFTPAGVGAGNGPFPMFVNISFLPTPGGSPPSTQAIDIRPSTTPTTRSASSQSTRAFYTRVADPEVAAQTFSQIFDRGYGLAIFNYQQAGVDNLNAKKSGFFAAYPDSDWGDIGAWAWSMSRVVDYLQTQPYVDSGKLIAIGHSRLGKTTLAAGALDDRFALVAPVGSGCAGTGAFRFNGPGRGGKQGLEDITNRFSWQFGPRLHEFDGQIDKLPFDQNWLIALVAPRAFIAAEALNDGACNGMATKHAWMGAKPVFDFLGAGDRLGINFREGRHALTDEDWKAVLDFADVKLRGMKAQRAFDQWPADALLH
jgi:dienelactone hydrolase